MPEIDSRSPLPSLSALAFDPIPTGGSMPSDYLRDSVRRLGYAYLWYAITFTMAYFASGFVNMIGTRSISGHFETPKVIVALVSIAIALLLFFLGRRRRVRPELLLDLGLVFEVLGAFGIAMTSMYGAFADVGPEDLQRIGTFGIPWECVWIVLFPLVTPVSAGKTLLAALGAASMGPLTMAISKLTGATGPGMSMSGLMSYYLFSTYLCAMLAFMTSFWVRKLGRQVKAAREIGQYQLGERLGRGGMGEVWRAKHRMLARPAAVKLIRPETLGRDEATRRAILRRFEREARATAALASVHTVEVFDFGITGDGSFYYVMELLDGIDLETLVQRHGPLPASRCIHLLRQACHSLGEAHGAGLVHRDVKPANIFTCRLGPDRDFVKVLDFGLVKTDDGVSADATRLTREGMAFGTPGYMPPEMAIGAGGSEPRSDLYSLGCVAYWLLTGLPVFEADTPLATVLHHVKTPPPRPSERCELAIPADLEAIVMECLAKDPADRPASAGALSDRLGACADAGNWTQSHAHAWWHDHGAPREERDHRSAFTRFDAAGETSGL